MKSLGLLFLIIGGLSLLFSVLPDSILIAMDFSPGLMRFINNYLIMMAVFLLSAGTGAFYVGKKYPRSAMKSKNHS